MELGAPLYVAWSYILFSPRLYNGRTAELFGEATLHPLGQKRLTVYFVFVAPRPEFAAPDNAVLWADGTAHR